MLQGYSIDAQLSALRDYALRTSLSVVHEFVESESAGETGRRKFREMLNSIEADPSISAILVWKVDRLFRNLKDRVTIDDLIRSKNLSLHLAYEGKVISKHTKPSDMLALDIHTDVARYELANLSERVKFGMNQKAVQGEYPGGKVPLGYLRNRYNKSIEVDTERAAIIKELFVLYADSEHSIDDLHYHATGIRTSIQRV